MHCILLNQSSECTRFCGSLDLCSHQDKFNLDTREVSYQYHQTIYTLEQSAADSIYVRNYVIHPSQVHNIVLFSYLLM